MTRKIALIGLGAMGFAMAKRLVERQHHVTGYDIRPEPMAALSALGGHVAETAKEAAQNADVIILMVVNADQAEAVLFDGGVCQAAGSGAHVVCMATCAPARVIAIDERVRSYGLKFVDAPVSGGVAGIEAGTLTIMAAADDETFSGCADLLRQIGSNTHHVGTRVGQGAALKTVNQLLAGVHIAAAAEALALAEREGIDKTLALDVLSNSAASSWMLKDRGPRMIEPGDEVRSAVEIFVKDLGIVADTGRAARYPTPLAAAALQLYLAASGMGLGSSDDARVIEVYRKQAGLTQ